MDSTASSKVTRFRPTSWEDFKTYASNLAWLLGEPIQSAQELLSRIYGYTDTHDLQQNLKRPGRSGAPGDEAKEIWELPYAESAEAHNRTLLTIREWNKKRGESRLESKREWKATEIGLFDPPSLHKAKFRRVKLALQVLGHQEPMDAELTTGHYATVAVVGVEGEPKEAWLHFTDIGRAVFDAGMNVIPDRFDNPDQSRLFDAMEELEALIDRHPANPWLPAMFVCSFSRHFFQDGWADNLPMISREGVAGRESHYESLDADPGYLKHARKNAILYLSLAKKSIALFDGLLGEHKEKAPDHRLSMSEGDAFYYPAIHFFGAMAAANAGDEKLAARWAAKNLKLVPGDNFGARYLLSALMLSEGRAVSSIERLCKAENRDGWMWTCVAASASHGRLKPKALNALTEMLTRDWAPLEIYGGKWDELREACRPSSNHGTPAFFQELDHRTKEFWKAAPQVRAFFERVCSDEVVRKAAFDHHAAQAQRWGLGFKDHAEQVRTRQMIDAASEALSDALQKRLPLLWDEVMGRD